MNQQIGNHDQQFKMECLGRYVARIGFKRAKLFLDGYEKRNGKEATDALRAEARKQYEKANEK